jgi:hypothetical protein
MLRFYHSLLITNARPTPGNAVQMRTRHGSIRAKNPSIIEQRIWSTRDAIFPARCGVRPRQYDRLATSCCTLTFRARSRWPRDFHVFEKSTAFHAGLSGLGRLFCPIQGSNRTKTFHVKQFCPIGTKNLTNPHTRGSALDAWDRGKNRSVW